MSASDRSLFEVPPEVCYLNAAYMAPRLRSVTAAGRRALTDSASPWNITARDFFTLPDQLRRAFATLIDAREDEIALVPSVSYGIGIAAANVPLQNEGKLLVLSEQFPSNVYPWQALARERGASLLTVDRPPDSDWTSAVLAALTEDVVVAALPQAHWTDGSRLDLVRIGERCRELGCLLALDLTQSLGAVPLSIREVRPDFMVAAAYKWLLGPYGVSYLYVAPQHHDGRPLEQAWIARAGSEDFAGLVDYRDEYRTGARRFDAGEHTSFVLLPMALAALKQILAWGPVQVASRLGRINQQIAECAVELGYDLPPAAARNPHMLGLRFPGEVPEDLLESLRASKVYVSVRGKCIRVAPHLHVDEGDLARFLDLLRVFAPAAAAG